jgi:hypothetical protein
MGMAPVSVGLVSPWITFVSAILERPNRTSKVPRGDENSSRKEKPWVRFY